MEKENKTNANDVHHASKQEFSRMMAVLLQIVLAIEMEKKTGDKFSEAPNAVEFSTLYNILEFEKVTTTNYNYFEERGRTQASKLSILEKFKMMF